MKSIRHILIAVAMSCFALPALAQPGPSGAGPKGPGYGFNKDNTPGWSMMSRAERDAHHEKMRSFKTVEECKTYMEEHHKTMEDRAKARGRGMRGPRVNACEDMQARGLIK